MPPCVHLRVLVYTAGHAGAGRAGAGHTGASRAGAGHAGAGRAGAGQAGTGWAGAGRAGAPFALLGFYLPLLKSACHSLA